jgi:hypothetical protein
MLTFWVLYIFLPPKTNVHQMSYSIQHITFFQPSLNFAADHMNNFMEKPPVVNFPTFYQTERFITVPTSAPHWSLTRASSIQSKPPHPISV